MAAPVEVRPVASKADRAAFIELAYRLNAGDPNWVPPLRAEARELIDPARNPFFEHGTVELFLARRGGEPVGRISAHIDHLALAQPPEQGMGPGVGFWGMFEAADAEVAAALIATAEARLRALGMSRALGPISLSVWDEPGLLTQGHDHPPTIMMGHHNPAYQGWIEALDYAPAKRLLTYLVPLAGGFAPIVRRIVALGERNPRIRIRPMDMSRFGEEADLMLGLLNRAWGSNWGFVPLSAREIAYVQKKLKPIIIEGLIMIAEVDGEIAAFMIVFPDLNEAIGKLGGRLFPFGWARLLWWLKRKHWPRFRVPLMGVAPELQGTRLASQLAFMLIEGIRITGAERYGVELAEIGWILEDNEGMISIARAVGGEVNRVYTVYEKDL